MEVLASKKILSCGFLSTQRMRKGTLTRLLS